MRIYIKSIYADEPELPLETQVSYMLLIVEPVGQRNERSPQAGHEAYDRMLRFAETLKARGVLLGCESLASTDQAVRVQTKDGRPSLLDGPFAETKEMVGGFFLLACETREEALAIAAECPAAEWCSVEVRRVAPCWE